MFHDSLPKLWHRSEVQQAPILGCGVAYCLRCSVSGLLLYYHEAKKKYIPFRRGLLNSLVDDPECPTRVVRAVYGLDRVVGYEVVGRGI